MLMEQTTFRPGSSPHVRGARAVRPVRCPNPGIIPACAGSTSALPKARPSPRDHPRMCGEHPSYMSRGRYEVGSSPHVRGAHHVDADGDTIDGIIPACAGSTETSTILTLPAGDHPRMCGEHLPRFAVKRLAQGSSPHVRGAHRHALRYRHSQGIIPACAGSTPSTQVVPCGRGDHPRMCGEHVVLGVHSAQEKGSSPHVRGAPDRYARSRPTGGIIPACAGSTRYAVRFRTSAGDHPRMCGEHRGCAVRSSSWKGSSPHVRGAQDRRASRPARPGIIPACAGSTSSTRLRVQPRRDHPRMCGEHPPMMPAIPLRLGSSPHVRGAPRGAEERTANRGIIPACAGSTSLVQSRH